MKTLYELSALTAEGFGGKDKYTKMVAAENDTELREAKRKFALEYNVDLGMVKDVLFQAEKKVTL